MNTMKLSSTSWLAALLLLVGCRHQPLTLYTDYLTVERLASYHVNTPDPCLESPSVGQRLVASWNLRGNHPHRELLLTIRFRNLEEITQRISLTRPTGTYVYPLLNEEYFARGGIQTYKGELFEEGYLIETWQHQLWTPLLRRSASEEEPLQPLEGPRADETPIASRSI